MRRIGISQRVEVISAYGERRDCLDQRWFQLFEGLGLIPVPVPNSLGNCRRWLEAMALDGVVLSGGNDIAELPDASRPAPERDQTERALLSWAEEKHLPLLGVCRGLQMLNLFLGGSLTPVRDHVARRHEVRPEPHEALFAGYREVNSFHNWGVTDTDLAPGLQPTLRSPDNFIEAVRHGDRPWLGVMWHPERESSFEPLDRQLLTHLFRGNP